MTWVRLDDAILDNHKIAAVGPIGFALHVAAITHCARNLTDGFLHYSRARTLLAPQWTEGDDDGIHGPKIQSIAIVSGMSGMDGMEAIEHTISTLCWIGLWEEIPHGYLIHDYLDYNPSKEAVLAERAKKSAAGKVGGERSATARRTTRGTAQPEAGASAAAAPSAQAPAQAAPEAESKPVPVPQEQNPPVLTTFGHPPKGRAIRLPSDWEPSDDLKAWAAKEHPQVNVVAVTDEFRNYWHARSERATKQGLHGWDLTWKNRIAEVAGKTPTKPLTSTNGHGPTPKSRNQLAAEEAARRLGLDPAAADPWAHARPPDPPQQAVIVVPATPRSEEK